MVGWVAFPWPMETTRRSGVHFLQKKVETEEEKSINAGPPRKRRSSKQTRKNIATKSVFTAPSRPRRWRAAHLRSALCSSPTRSTASQPLPRRRGRHAAAVAPTCAAAPAAGTPGSRLRRPCSRPSPVSPLFPVPCTAGYCSLLLLGDYSLAASAGPQRFLFGNMEPDEMRFVGRLV
jgi:hypothetical protein